MYCVSKTLKVRRRHQFFMGWCYFAILFLCIRVWANNTRTVGCRELAPIHGILTPWFCRPVTAIYGNISRILYTLSLSTQFQRQRLNIQMQLQVLILYSEKVYNIMEGRYALYGEKGLVISNNFETEYSTLAASDMHHRPPQTTKTCTIIAFSIQLFLSTRCILKNKFNQETFSLHNHSSLSKCWKANGKHWKQLLTLKMLINSASLLFLPIFHGEQKATIFSPGCYRILSSR